MSAANDEFWPDRVVKDVPAPAPHPLAHDRLFGANGKPKLDVLQEHFLKEGRLHKADVLQIVQGATNLLKAEPNMLDLDAPLTICGDTHGQYYDLLSLFKVGGDPNDTTYLFLGDYVDRGNFSMEIVLHLYCLKILHPQTVFMLRGNHECRHLTEFFTFKQECLYKYDLEVYDAIMTSFDALPLAALVNEQFLCVHGGISPEIETIDEIQELDRFREPPSKGPMCDLMWADPMENFEEESDTFFEYNEVRGCSYMFSFKAVCDFLERNQLLSLIRAHEAQDAGYKMHLTNEATGFPSCITLFSAPNYLDAYGNKGAVLRYDGNVMNIRQFNHTPHPYYLPGFMDVFAWSTPFVTEKVADILLVLLNLPDPPTPKEQDEAARIEAERRREAVKKKIRAVSKMRLMMKTLREERETILQIKELAPNGTIPKGLLTQGAPALKKALGDFEKVKSADRINERRPGEQDDASRRLKGVSSGGERRLKRKLPKKNKPLVQVNTAEE